MGTLSQRLTDAPIINVMANAAFKAAKSLIRDFNEVEHLVVSKKGPGDFVSSADKRAEKIIFAELKKAYPRHGFLMEETGRVDADSPYCWVIDPLDGTNNFLHGTPHFCISIALVKSGVTQAGIIYDPIRDELFWAERGRGAFLNNRRIRVSNRESLRGALCLATLHGVYSTDHPASHKACFDELFRQAQVRIYGSAALNLAYIAAARADGYVAFDLSPWDVMAGILLIQEAGGSVYPFLKKEDIHSGKSIIATNEYLLAPLERIFKKWD